MSDPMSLADAFTSLGVGPTDEHAVQFQTEWDRHTGDYGHPQQLPVGWRSEIRELASLGLTPEEVARCAAKGSTDGVAHGQRFAHAMDLGRRTALWKRNAAERTKAAARARDGIHELVLNERSDIVHAVTCPTLVTGSPCNLRPVANIEPHRPCKACLG